MLKKVALNAGLVAVCLGAGLWAGPMARAGYEHLFPAPAFIEGDYANLYRQAGKDIVMFSTSTCPHCSDARALLQREGVAYQDYLIDGSPEAKRQFDALGGSGVPLLFIGDRRILGYRESVIRESLALAGMPPSNRKQ
jgi:glutaredoxin